MTARVLIAGGSGSLGLSLAAHLTEAGYPVFILTRQHNLKIHFEQIIWDGKSLGNEAKEILPNSILINLAGELVDRIPTKKNVDLLRSSRVEPTRALAQAAKDYGLPKLWLQMSTLAIYGDAGDQILTEDSPAANGPVQMAGVARAWEAEVTSELAKRLVIMRTAVVLQPNSPALNRITTVTKMFLGGQVANGKQWFSWIHYKDFLNAVTFLIDSKLEGIVHLTSPEPRINKDLMAILRKILSRRLAIPAPAFAIKLGAYLIFRTDPQLALTGRRAIPQRLQEHGFKFQYASLEQSLKDLLS